MNRDRPCSLTVLILGAAFLGLPAMHSVGSVVPEVQSKPAPASRKTSAPKTASKVARLNPERINDATLTDVVGAESRGDTVLRAQILLDRLHFSSGEIDAVYGDNLQRAIAAFQNSFGLEESGLVDEATWQALNAQTGGGSATNGPVAGLDQPDSSTPALVSYTITLDDIRGPFTKPLKARNGEELMMKQAKLARLNYASPLEALAAKFHVSSRVLTQLNPGKKFAQGGEQIIVPNVITPVPGTAATVIVDASDSSVTALSAEGTVLARYPATIGSEHDPLPIGNWEITGKHFNPKFNYNAELFWDAQDKNAKATLPPGPKSPVGVVWIDLSKEHYGIHGTPNPTAIGKTQSHGCIRLTNWDAEELAKMVSPGTPAILQE